MTLEQIKILEDHKARIARAGPETSLMAIEQYHTAIITLANPLLAAAKRGLEFERVAGELANAVRVIHYPLGDETENKGNPCTSPSPPHGRALAKALLAYEQLTKKEKL